MDLKRKIVISLIIVSLAFILGRYAFGPTNIAGRSVSTGQEFKITPLSNEERQKVTGTLISSEFIKDVPEKNPIALIFFKFENGQRVWQEGFLIGNNQILSEGEPTMKLILHSKYIAELNGDNLCETIKKAKQNGDLGFQSDYGKVKLFIKYKGMLKHRECFGV
tara:strand:+ start:425 stop:916 length:492 start_codon:yes stop_codon:yes gene_type:complete